MKAKTIKALDAVIAGLEELKEALEMEASKSGSAADDEDSGKVSGPGKKAKAAVVPAAGKKSKAAPPPDDDEDDDDGVDGDDDADDEDDDLPPPKTPVKGKAAAPAAKKTAAKKGKAEEATATIGKVKEKLTAVMNEATLGKAAVLKILKKHGATKSAELEEEDYAAVIKACDAALASVPDEADDEDEDV